MQAAPLQAVPRADLPSETAAVRVFLQECGFTEEGIAARLGLASIHEFVPLRKGRTAGCDLETALDAAIRLFLDGDFVLDERLRALLPPGLPEVLESLCLAARGEGGAWFATVALYPVGPLLIASDRSNLPDSAPFRLPPDCVYPVSDQTQAFLATLPPLPCERLLDLGTGSGAAALLSAAYATRAWGVDIAARPVRFAEFNRVLNRCGNVVMLEGDLYEPLAGATFDRVVAHPPYVPVGKSTFVYRDGGEDGEQVLRRIVEGLPRHLEPGGRFYGYAMASDREGEMLEERIRRWLGEREAEFDVLLVSSTTVTPDRVASPWSTEEKAHWSRIYETLRVKYIFLGSILIERHRVPRASYTVRTAQGPDSGWREAEWLRRWMRACATGDGARIVLASRPRLSGRLEVRIVQKVREGRLVVEECTLATAYPFDTTCVCQPWIAQTVAACSGEATGREHFAEGMRRKSLPGHLTESDFARVLCGMVSGGFLEVPEYPFPAGGSHQEHETQLAPRA